MDTRAGALLTEGGTMAGGDAADAAGRPAGMLMAAGGVLALAWGAWLLSAMLALTDGPPTGTALRRAVAAMGTVGEVAWLAANACWLAGLAALAARGRLARPLLVFPVLGVLAYLAASLLTRGLIPRWPLRVPPTALGTVLWSLGMIMLAMASGWPRGARAVSLAIGLFYVLVPLPAMVLLGHPPVYLLGVGWGLLWIALGAIAAGRRA